MKLSKIYFIHPVQFMGETILSLSNAEYEIDVEDHLIVLTHKASAQYAIVAISNMKTGLPVPTLSPGAVLHLPATPEVPAKPKKR